MVGTADLTAEIVSSFSATVAVNALISRPNLFSLRVYFLGLFEFPLDVGFLPKSLLTFQAAVLIAANSSFSSGDNFIVFLLGMISDIHPGTWAFS